MKIAIVYKSITGNTKLVAERINSILKDVVYFGNVNDNIDADIYIVGSWTDKGDCDKEIKEFLKQLHNKKIIYFQTAGFGGSKEYYDRLFDRVKTNIDKSNEILGSFFCQGKMPISVKKRYEKLIKDNPNDKDLKVSIDNFNQASIHPNKKDLDDVEIFIKKIIK